VDLGPSGFDRVGHRSATTSLLRSLYVSTAVVQALDVHSTISVLNHGGAEGNPLLASMVNKRPAFVAFKAAIAASSIVAARQIAGHNKIAAVALLVGVNSAYAMVVSHNYKLARELGQTGF
jgi:hypothetical protein